MSGMLRTFALLAAELDERYACPNEDGSIFVVILGTMATALASCQSDRTLEPDKIGTTLGSCCLSYIRWHPQNGKPIHSEFVCQQALKGILRFKKWKMTTARI
jgi:hypothetical protein